MIAFRLAPLLIAGWTSGAAAQYAPPSVTTPPPTTYGVQPYDPARPTGLVHPNDMGFGQYHNPTQLKGHRPAAFKDRRFRGY